MPIPHCLGSSAPIVGGAPRLTTNEQDRRICPIPSKAPPATILEIVSEPCGKTPVLHGNEESEMSPSPYRPGQQPPPVPEPNRTPRPIEEPEPEDLPDEKRTPNPDEVREPPIHTHPIIWVTGYGRSQFGPYAPSL